MITYQFTADGNVGVRLNGKAVGVIKCANGRYRYFPKGQQVGGEAFHTLRECQASLQDDHVKEEEHEAARQRFGIS